MLTSQAGPSRDVSAGGGHGDDEVCAWMLTYVCVLADYHSQIDTEPGESILISLICSSAS